MCRHDGTKNQAAVDFRRLEAEKLHDLCTFWVAVAQGPDLEGSSARCCSKRQADVDFWIVSDRLSIKEVL